MSPVNGSSDTGIPNDVIWFGLMSECYIKFPKNRASFRMIIYTVPSPFTTAVVDLPIGTLVI